MTPTRPTSDQYPSGLHAYISVVPGGDIFSLLQSQLDEISALFGGLSETQAGYRYAPGKWSLKDILQHLSDAERVFAYRGLCIGRGDVASLPGFDEDAYAVTAQADRRSLTDLLAEWRTLREASLALFRSLPEETWSNVGTANQKSVIASAFPFVCMGHAAHHLAVIRERYLPGLS